MTDKLTQEQLNKNYGQFIHEGLFLTTVTKLEDDIANSGGGGGTPATGVVKKLNGKTPNAQGELTIAGEDIIADKAVPGSSVTKAIQDLAAEVSGKASTADLAGFVKTVNGQTPDSSTGAVTLGTDNIPADPADPQGDKLNVAIKGLTQGLAGKVDSNTLNDYVKTTDLTTDLVPYLKTADLATTLAATSLWTDMIARIVKLETP